jgi:hypothetical protein
MELRETDDPVKGQLLKKSAMHRQKLEEEVKLISDQTQKILTNAVIVGGALALTYVLVTQLTGSSESKKKPKRIAPKTSLAESDDIAIISPEPEPPGIVSQIGAALASQATIFLLTLAKEKLAEYLQSQKEKKAGPNEPS